MTVHLARSALVNKTNQPDDPGVDYAPLRFEHSFAGREVAYLGMQMFGELHPKIWGSMNRYDVVIFQRGCPAQMKADTAEHAKRLLCRSARDWLAGICAPDVMQW